MKNVLVAVLAIICMACTPSVHAQDLKRMSWEAFGVSFNGPKDMIVEDDSEEGFVVSNDTYYVSIQILDGEAMNKNALVEEVKQVAEDDQLQDLSPVTSFELPQFHGAQLQGASEGEFYLYNYLMSKDESGGFFVTIIFKEKNDALPTNMIKSFQLVD